MQSVLQIVYIFDFDIYIFLCLLKNMPLNHLLVVNTYDWLLQSGCWLVASCGSLEKPVQTKPEKLC